MTDETKPASDADVVEAMCSAVFFKPIVAAGRLTMIDALTAARSLGVLMPEEAAGLRGDCAFLDQQWIGAEHRALSMMAQRDALAARLARAEEALREAIAIIAMVEAHTPAKYLPGAYPMYGREKLRATLTPPSTEARPDAE